MGTATEAEQTFLDKNGEELKTTSSRHIRFIKDMEAAGIPWFTYSGKGMYGAYCPAVSVSGRSDLHEQDVYRATALNGLHTESLGRGMVIYAQ